MSLDSNKNASDKPGAIHLATIVCACTILVGCVLPQSDRYVVREDDSSTFLVYPPGPLPDGHAEVLVPGVVDQNAETACTEIPVIPGQSVIGARLHPPYNLLANQELVITIDESIRGDRARVVDAIGTFLAAQIGPGVDGQLDCLITGVAPLIKSAVIDSVPVSYDEILTLAFGFDKESRSVDVLPGQAFCVEYADGRFRLDSDGGSKGRQFFAGGSRSCYRLDRGPTTAAMEDNLTFSPFLREIGEINVLDRNANGVRSATSRRVAGTVDLNNTESTTGITHYRLYYNTGFSRYQDRSQPIDKFNGTPLLIGGHCPGDTEIIKRIGIDNIPKICVDPRASDWKTFVDAAFSSLQTDDVGLAARFSSCAGSGFINWRPVCHLFNERGVPFPQVDVVIDGESRLIEMQRTVWHVLEQGELHRYRDLLHEGVPKTLVSQTMERELANLKVYRRFRGRTYPVHFEVINIDALMLPLLPGDEVSR